MTGVRFQTGIGFSFFATHPDSMSVPRSFLSSGLKVMMQPKLKRRE